MIGRLFSESFHYANESWWWWWWWWWKGKPQASKCRWNPEENSFASLTFEPTYRFPWQQSNFVAVSSIGRGEKGVTAGHTDAFWLVVAGKKLCKWGESDYKRSPGYPMNIKFAGCICLAYLYNAAWSCVEGTRTLEINWKYHQIFHQYKCINTNIKYC